jgi:hypothetical protein
MYLCVLYIRSTRNCSLSRRKSNLNRSRYCLLRVLALPVCSPSLCPRARSVALLIRVDAIRNSNSCKCHEPVSRPCKTWKVCAKVHKNNTRKQNIAFACARAYTRVHGVAIKTHAHLFSVHETRNFSNSDSYMCDRLYRFISVLAFSSTTSTLVFRTGTPFPFTSSSGIPSLGSGSRFSKSFESCLKVVKQ